MGLRPTYFRSFVKLNVRRMFCELLSQSSNQESSFAASLQMEAFYERRSIIRSLLYFDWGQPPLFTHIICIIYFFVVGDIYSSRKSKGKTSMHHARREVGDEYDHWSGTRQLMINGKLRANERRQVCVNRGKCYFRPLFRKCFGDWWGS